MDNLTDLFMALAVGVIDRIKGPRTLKKKETPHDSNSTLKIITNLGHELNIFCRETHYCLIYHNWWVPNIRKTIYHVHCVCGMGTPSDIIDRFYYDGHIPRFTSRFLPAKLARWRAIEAYIDGALVGTNIQRAPGDLN